MPLVLMLQEPIPGVRIHWPDLTISELAKSSFWYFLFLMKILKKVPLLFAYITLLPYICHTKVLVALF